RRCVREQPHSRAHAAEQSPPTTGGAAEDSRRGLCPRLNRSGLKRHVNRSTMNFLSPPSATSRVSQRPGDDLDGVLSTFYQAQMPSPWPPLQLPVAAALPSTRLVFWQRVKRSHLALAASVA